MKVVLISNTLQGYAPDVYVLMTTAEQIGELQAKELVNKLRVRQGTSDAPKQIEVLLPYDAADGHDAKTDTSSPRTCSKASGKLLEPYFKGRQSSISFRDAHRFDHQG